MTSEGVVREIKRKTRRKYSAPEPITRILAHIGEPTSPPLIHPARGPPQPEFDLGEFHAEERGEEMDLATVPDHIDQTPEYDPTEACPTRSTNHSLPPKLPPFPPALPVPHHKTNIS